MCNKTINIDTYADGTQKVYEVVETCRPGTTHLCSSPRVTTVRRFVPSSLSPSASKHHRHHHHHHHHHDDGDLLRPSSRGSSGIDFMRLPPSPRHSHSPTPSGGSGSEGRRRRHEHRSSGVYVNGERLVDLSSSSSSHRRSPRPDTTYTSHRSSGGRGVDIIQPRAPRFVPEAPTPPPRLVRASTLPAQECVVVQGRRPHPPANASARRAVRESTAIPIPPPAPVSYPVPGLSRRASAAYPSLATASTPLILVDDERERAERRRRREERRASMFVGTRSAAATAAAPAVAAAGKQLRWEDEERVRQNARIANRPPKLYQEPRGILKTPLSPTSAVRPAVEVVVPERERLADLRRSMSGLGLESGVSEARRARREDAAMKERLAARFGRSGSTAGAGAGVGAPLDRGSRVYYPGEGLYKYL